MPRKFNPLPTSRFHKRTGRAVVTVRNHLGARQDVLLPGDYDSQESRREYERILAVVLANRGRLPAPAKAAPDLTIAELLVKYLDFAEGYYVNPDTREPTTELQCLRDAFRPLNRLYGPEPAAEFDSLKLEALQAAMAAGSWLSAEEREKKAKGNKPVGQSRTTVNRHVDRVRRLFKWACAKKLYPADSLVNLQAVPGLKQGRSKARETDQVAPVDRELVEQTLPLLPTVPADLLRVLPLSGARVGEVCRMKGAELDRSGAVWLFKPHQHKGRHRGEERIIAIGPRAQLILRRYLMGDPDAYLFSPAEAEAQRKAELRAKRKTPVQPSQVCRAKKNPKRQPGQRYNHNSLNSGIRRACRKAGLEVWTCHQLRHAAALLVMHEFGLEAARSTLGHKQVSMTLHYSGIDTERAKDVASKIG